MIIRGILTFWFIIIFDKGCTALKEPGCADGTREGLDTFERIAACHGEWQGHIANGGHLCSPGWSVCSHDDRLKLREITWEDAVSFEGCYAFNAAQDGGGCHECTDHLEKDDLAAVGRGCPHQNYGQTSCISGGRIDASCCVDSYFNKSCVYQPGWMSGVLCCKTQGTSTGKFPFLHGSPFVKFDHLGALSPAAEERLSKILAVREGHPVSIPCKVSYNIKGNFIKWYKEGKVLAESSHVSFDFGDVSIFQTKLSDSGLYTCTYTTKAGRHMSAKTQLLVEPNYTGEKGLRTGCARGVREDLQYLKHVRACSGKWRGHVRYGRSLCADGWHVCSVKDKASLREISWNDNTNTEGCYAYDAEDLPDKCSSCHGDFMAGLGRDCEVARKKPSSCLTAGHVTVSAKPRSGCHYRPGVMSGVLCCRNRHFKTTVCEPDCGLHGVCVIDRGICSCHKGYAGRYCTVRLRHRKCHAPCHNGGRCHKGRCVCSKLFWGRSCQHVKWFRMED